MGRKESNQTKKLSKYIFMGFHNTNGCVVTQHKMGFFVDKVMFCQKIFLEAMIKKYENKPLERLKLQCISILQKYPKI